MSSSEVCLELQHTELETYIVTEADKAENRRITASGGRGDRIQNGRRRKEEHLYHQTQNRANIEVSVRYHDCPL